MLWKGLVRRPVRLAGGSVHEFPSLCTLLANTARRLEERLARWLLMCRDRLALPGHFQIRGRPKTVLAAGAAHGRGE